MRALALTLALLCGAASVSAQVRTMDKPAFTEADAVRAVDAGACGPLGLGTGLVDGKGWLHQPIPGKVLIRTVSAAGTLQTIAMKNSGVAPQHQIELDMYAGKPHYITVQWAMSNDRLEWKVPGHAWGPVPIGFQLPPAK